MKIQLGAGARPVLRLVRGALLLLWMPLAGLTALYVGFHLPLAIAIMATRGEMAASRYLHGATDWIMDWVWKICPANEKV